MARGAPKFRKDKKSCGCAVEQMWGRANNWSRGWSEARREVGQGLCPTCGKRVIQPLIHGKKGLTKIWTGLGQWWPRGGHKREICGSAIGPVWGMGRLTGTAGVSNGRDRENTWMAEGWARGWPWNCAGWIMCWPEFGQECARGGRRLIQGRRRGRIKCGLVDKGWARGVQGLGREWAKDVRGVVHGLAMDCWWVCWGLLREWTRVWQWSDKDGTWLEQRVGQGLARGV